MQSEIDLLREINLKLLAKITKLRKENAEGISKQLNHSDHSIKKNNANPISQNFDSIPLDQINIPFVANQYDTTKSKSLKDDRETDFFLDVMHKKKDSFSTTSVSFYSLTSLYSEKNAEKLFKEER
ncbi:hypothetical protein C1645_829855 [Glomus cerebriforme]|uniref:Uncharacterized protein n=1 Tax=Glomus cerebriforme TaxID=658196 RepID=A0A397SQ46_9GLOM|nr:hypothetical protein C1645_829855 [Glomus cerebriforme]